MFYPGEKFGKTEPYTSPRLKAFRRGQQDIEYLAMLAAKAGWSREQVTDAMNAALDLGAEVASTSAEDPGRARYCNVTDIPLRRRGLARRTEPGGGEGRKKGTGKGSDKQGQQSLTLVPEIVRLLPMRRRRSFAFRRPAGVAALALALACLEGCVCVPTPVSRNVARAPGVRQARPKLDFVAPGATSRGELERVLAPFVAVSGADFLWARWQQVSSPVACNAGDDGRDWETVNVLAAFDTRGVLIHYRRCRDRDLVAGLAFLAERAACLPEAEAVTFFVSHQGSARTANDFFGNASVDAAGLHILQTGGGAGPLRYYDVPSALVESFAATKAGSAEHVAIELRLAAGGPPVRKLEAGLPPGDMWRLVRHLRPGAAPSGCAPRNDGTGADHRIPRSPSGSASTRKRPAGMARPRCPEISLITNSREPALSALSGTSKISRPPVE